MKIKTFYAKSMVDALESIKSELGPDALILSTKEIPRRATTGRSRAGFEVVAAVDQPDDLDLDASRPPNRNRAKPSMESPEVLEPSEAQPAYVPPALYTNSGAMRHRGLARKESGTREGDSGLRDALAAEVYQHLVTSGVEDWLARKLLTEALTELTAVEDQTRPALLRSMAHVVQGLISAPVCHEGTPRKRVVVFVGPTGVGKTTSIAKLAARLALQERKKVVLMTLDGFRIGAVEQLKIYARLVGIPFRFVSQVSDLPKAIAEHSQRDYILVDTAGRGPRDLDAARELADVVNLSSEIERHLVVSATTKTADLQEVVDRFEICKPDYLLFTKVDETGTLGPILNELVRAQKPLSYYSDGQRVPEDLHTLPKERIIEMVLNED